MNQEEDVLLSKQEAQRVIESIKWEEYVSTVKEIVDGLCSWSISLPSSSQEIFYISSRASIIDTLNETSQVVAETIESCNKKWEISASMVMALALNNILVRMADRWEMPRISNSIKEQAYRTHISIEWKWRYGMNNYIVQWKAKALQKALKTRKRLSDERIKVKTETKTKLHREKLRQWLIEKWILIPTIISSQDSTTHWPDEQVFKVRNIYYRSRSKSSGMKFVFSLKHEWESTSKSATLSVHQGNAYDVVVEELCRFFWLSFIEQSILKEDQYRDTWLYKEKIDT